MSDNLRNARSQVVATNIENILDLIYVSYDYGFAHDVLLDAFAGMMNRKLDRKDIDRYIVNLRNKEEEDHDKLMVEEKASNRLYAFKNKYCPD